MPETVPFGVAHVGGLFRDGEVVMQPRLNDLGGAQRLANELAAETSDLQSELVVLNAGIAEKMQRKTDIEKRLEVLKARRNELLSKVEQVLFPMLEPAKLMALRYAEERLRAAQNPTVNGYLG